VTILVLPCKAYANVTDSLQPSIHAVCGHLTIVGTPSAYITAQTDNKVGTMKTVNEYHHTQTINGGEVERLAAIYDCFGRDIIAVARAASDDRYTYTVRVSTIGEIVDHRVDTLFECKVLESVTIWKDSGES
jgi:hypothetical protein